MPEQKIDDNKNYVSMLDLQADTDEIMGFNPEADANALLPPVPAGQYYARLRFTDPDIAKRWVFGVWGRDEQKVVYTSLTAEIYASEGGVFDGRQVRDGLVSSMIRQQTGTCRIQGVIQAITGSFPPSCRTRPQLVQLMNDTIHDGGSATAVIEVDWEASENLSEEERDVLKTAGKRAFRLQGMKNFPKDAEGNPIPEVMHNGETHRAYNVITRYITAPEGGLQGEQVESQAAQAPVQASGPRVLVPTASVVPTVPGVQGPQGPPVPRRVAPRPAPRAR